MKKKYFIFIAFVLLLLDFFFRFKQKPSTHPPEEQAASTDFVPLPTMVVPPGFEHPLTAMILDVLNVSLSESEDTSQGDMSRRSGPALNGLKGGLLLLITANLNGPAGQWKGLSDCEEKVRKEARDASEEASDIFRKALGASGKGRFYQPIEEGGIQLAEVSGHQDLVVAATSVEVNCGKDDSFYLFQKKAGRYQLVLSQEDDDQASTGQEGLEYEISPADEKGEFFIALAYGRPWCTSCWGGLETKILRLGPAASHPKILYSGSEYVYRCGKTILDAGKDDFRMTFTGSQSLDTDVLTRKCIRHYRVLGDQVRLVGPWGDFPEDFLDEWINNPWDDAKSFCQGKDISALKDWHEKLRDSKGLDGFLFIQPCSGEPQRWEIGVKTDDKALPSQIFFEILKKDGDFYLEDIRKTRLGTCPGESKPEQHPVDMG
jgi:hypothetical protein